MLRSFARAACALTITGSVAAPAFASVKDADSARIAIESTIAENAVTLPGAALNQQTQEDAGASDFQVAVWWEWLVGGGGPR